MKTQQIQNTFKNVQRTTGTFSLWLGIGLLLIVTALTITVFSRPATIIPNTGSPIIKAQTVPDAAAQSVENYLRAHSNPSAQSVPEASAQGVTSYLQAHSNPFAQSVLDASVQSVTDYLQAHSANQPVIPFTDPAVQSVADYLRLHSNEMSAALITDPAQQSVMDYLKAHGIQP